MVDYVTIDRNKTAVNILMKLDQTIMLKVLSIFHQVYRLHQR